MVWVQRITVCALLITLCTQLASKSNHAALAALVKTSPGNRAGLQHFTGDDTQRWQITAP